MFKRRKELPINSKRQQLINSIKTKRRHALYTAPRMSNTTNKTKNKTTNRTKSITKHITKNKSNKSKSKTKVKRSNRITN